MLTRLREIVEKVASAPRLNEALNILVTDICLAMDTEVCSVYLADHDRRCYYLMATRGLKKPRGRTVALAFDEGIVGLVGRLAEPINLADAQKHPSFKYIPSVKEERFRAFLGVPIIQRRQLLGVLVVQQRELRQYDESEESFLVTLATQMAAILSQSQLNALFGQYRQTRIRALPAAPGHTDRQADLDAGITVAPFTPAAQGGWCAADAADRRNNRRCNSHTALCSRAVPAPCSGSSHRNHHLQHLPGGTLTAPRIGRCGRGAV